MCHPALSHPGKPAPHFLLFNIPITATTTSWLGPELQVKKNTCLQYLQNFPYLTLGKVSKRKGHLSQHLPNEEAASLPVLLLARAATPNTPLKVIF